MSRSKATSLSTQMTELPPQGLSTWFEVFNQDGDWKWFPSVELAKKEAQKWKSNGKTAQIQTPAWNWDKDNHAYVEVCIAVSHQQEVDRGTEFVENDDGIFYDFDEHMHRFYLTSEMVEKYSLHEVATKMDDDELEEMKEELENESVNYTHEILIDDVIAYRKTKDDHESTTMTPWGEVWSKTFEAYFNNFPVALYDEPEENAYYSQV